MMQWFRQKKLKAGKKTTSRRAWSDAPSFETLEPRQMMSVTADLVGNSLATALAVSDFSNGTAIYSDALSSADKQDFYKITLDSAQILELSLTGLTANANMRLLDANGRTLLGSGRGGASSESIAAVLQAGTYYAYVYRCTGATTYSLTMTATDPIADNAGNSRGTANNLGTLTSATASDYVGATDTNDYYKFTVSGLSNVKLNLTGLAADADVQLLNASGRLIARSVNSGSADESITTILTAGTYYVRVYRYAGNTNYTLSATATTIPDNAGNTRAMANNIGALSTEVTFADFIGYYDANDYYTFTVSAQSTLSLSLKNLTANATIQLLNSAGRVIKASANAGTADEAINTTLETGTYFIRVVCTSGNTNYTLTASATAIAPAPEPEPEPTPDPTPVPDTNSNTNPGTVNVVNLVSLKELDIVGSSGNDTITLTQSSGVLTLNINGNVTTYTITAINIAEIAIWGGDGNDTITVATSVTLATRVYGGAGNDVLTNQTKGRATIVSIGGGVDVLTGNGLNTSFWFDASDTAHTTAADVTAGRVHQVASFYQPFTTNTASTDYVSLELNGQNLKDPTDSGTTIRLTNRSFWGTNPNSDDVNQGYLGDCYYLATIAAMADTSENILLELAVDLGDGTYAVMYKRNGVTSYVRVDGDLAASGSWTEYNSTGSSGSIWACIMEKAYAYYRTGADTYASIEGGLMSAVFRDFGLTNTTVNPGYTTDASLYASVSSALAAGKSVTVGTKYSISGGIPMIGGHAYQVVSVTKDASGNISYVVRNPWGFDGASNSSDLSDGLITLTAAQLKSSCDLATWMT